ncbi:YXWGXW repeat-containing protein [Mucilaginibacter phyllosphaerae]|uniref:YXWGXW repeat-containing protein n=1 Tax=Mucilaginibacter phyllosphaerae TaxID=1812349 RepID=A0A4Y8ALN8_9SPHI|nr:YXWGXW repeat-containing protein [Mucilaginibacter phyllosphaerae]MBB3967639.1 hypothetical protein [Mucilaginibacter phyllosphaerae]TEW69305.1 hypothetical protein E2R65_03825 [Mucilaginibacter phyllosphaerae]GGH04274.1 hypothetical protein GCM10007352_07400 [Mucilaginibacter phyllosphaerae]
MKKVIKSFALLALIVVSSSKLFAQVIVGISINVAPPQLPVYTQPACPVDGYLWVPGYWAYDNNAGDYYWVPGVWVSPPRPHYLWTPGYWGYDGSIYSFHAGYWGRHIGFYGGVNYGYGYGGTGFGGGQWVGNLFRYNTAVVNVDKTIVKNTYIDKTVIVNNTTINNRSSFNGRGGVNAAPKPEELAAMKEKHAQPTPDQLNHQQTAMADRSQHASANRGKPAVTAYNKVNGESFGHKGKAARVTDSQNNPKPANDDPAKTGATAAEQKHALRKQRQSQAENNAAMPKMEKAQKPAKPVKQHAEHIRNAPAKDHHEARPRR